MKLEAATAWTVDKPPLKILKLKIKEFFAFDFLTVVECELKTHNPSSLIISLNVSLVLLDILVLSKSILVLTESNGITMAMAVQLPWN